jgi:hypothetical protein
MTNLFLYPMTFETVLNTIETRPTYHTKSFGDFSYETAFETV